MSVKQKSCKSGCLQCKVVIETKVSLIRIVCKTRMYLNPLCVRAVSVSVTKGRKGRWERIKVEKVEE
jgi:hypothetical protein